MKKYSVLALVSLLTLSMVSVSMAEEQKQPSQGERTLTGFFKKVFNYSGNTVKETAGTTANVLNNTGEKVVAKTGENTAAVVKGDVVKTVNVVTDSVKGTAETSGQAVSDTASIPVKAAEKA